MQRQFGKRLRENQVISLFQTTRSNDMCRYTMQTGIGRRVPRHIADSLSALLHFRVEPSSNGTINCLTDSLLTTNGMSLHHRDQRHFQMQTTMVRPMDKVLKNPSPKNWDSGCKRFVNRCILVRRYLIL